ncbi:MAG: CooT family nickel-binding protein [Desulfobacterales bacterium]|nr:CooT family nickel-binding protein [Desulfobacterales bacterium]MCP4163826.1 CooT family nickel-binding protein [Deltaproteobacteria bacterium]
MCEANAYLIKEDDHEMVMESVDKVIPDNDGVLLTNIFGAQKFIKGKIESLSLVDHKIFIREG